MTPEEHQAAFAQVSLNLIKLAETLIALHPEFAKADFGRCFLTVAIGLLSADKGDEIAAAYLREIASQIHTPDDEAGGHA